MARSRILASPLRKLLIAVQNQQQGPVRAFSGAAGTAGVLYCRQQQQRRSLFSNWIHLGLLEALWMQCSSSAEHRPFSIQLRCSSHAAEREAPQSEEVQDVAAEPAPPVAHAGNERRDISPVVHLNSEGPQQGEPDEDALRQSGTLEHHTSDTSPTPPPKPPSLRGDVLNTLNRIVKSDDLDEKLAPFEGKVSFQDGATIMKLLDDKRLCYSFYVWLKKQPNFAPDLASLTTVIRYLVLTSKWEKLIDVTQDLFDSGFVLDNGAYCRIIKEASLNGKIAVCEWWFQKMKDNGCQPDQTTYNTMAHAFALAKLPEKSFAIFEEMKEVGIGPDINTFCHLLDACRRAGDPDTAYNTFLQMGNLGLTPDLVSYSILLDTYGKHGKATEAGALFGEMQASGITPDAKAYNTLLHAYGKAGMMDHAKAIFDEYRNGAAGVQAPDKIVFWTMLHLYAQAGLMKEALAVKKMMRVASIPVDVSCYANLIDGFRRIERWEDAARAFKEMQRYKYPIAVTMYEMMIKIYASAGQHVDCERIFDQMMEQGYRDRKDAYEVMINVYKRTNNITNATRVFELMKRNNCVPNRSVCNTMIHIYAKAGMLPACEKIAEEMGEYGIKPNRDTFRTLIRAYTVYRQYYSAIDMYDLMKEGGITPDYELSELIVEVLLKTGQVNRAEKFLKDMITSGINPNKRMVAEVLRAGGVVELAKPLAVSRTRSSG